MNDFVLHACEQVLRFSSVNNWNDLSEERRVQLAFNMGVVALGLSISKQDGYDSIASACKGETSVPELHKHLRSLLLAHNVMVNEENVARPF